MSTTSDLAAVITALADMNLDAPEAELIDQLTALEKIKAAAAAAQARLTVAFDRTHTTRMTELRVDAAEIRRSVRAQIALARRDTRAKGDHHVATAAALVRELPRTLAALTVGDTSERAAASIAREVAHLPAQQRAMVDAELADRLAQWGHRRTEREARRLVIRLDPAGAADRAEKAAGGRRVTIRPAPNAMTYLTALLPAADGVACYAALHQAATGAAVDPHEHRTRGQVMADELSARILAAACTADGSPRIPTAQIHLVMTDRTLLDGDDEPAQLVGHGPVPAALARHLVLADHTTRVWIRRLYTDPHTGLLTDTDHRPRLFPPAARDYLTARDHTCRTPYCDAPIAHADHAIPAARGGQTTLTNGDGRCQACNYTKDATGWTTSVDPDGTITTTTPTGHRHQSRPPNPPRSQPKPIDLINTLGALILEYHKPAA